MSHKKFHLARLISMICSTVIISAVIVYSIISVVNENADRIIPIVIAVGVIYLAVFLLFGRVFCGFLCPLGLFQDIIWKITEKLHLPKLSRNGKFMKVMNILNTIFLIFFICVIIALIVIVSFFSEILTKINIPVLVLIIVIPIVMIVLNSFARRLFCNVCPIGSFIGLFEKLNIIKLQKDCNCCTVCGACYEACPMRIKEIYIEKEKKNVSSSKCLYCGECIKKCPNDDALSIIVCGKTVYKSSREDFLNNQFSDVTVNIKDKKNERK